MRQRLSRIAIGFLLTASVALAGCAGSPPSRFYALSPMPAAEAQGTLAGGRIAVGLGPVNFPVSLDRPQVVYRESVNRLELNEFQRWGGSVQDDFLRVWSENLAYLLGTSRVVIFPTELRSPLDFRIVADVLTFEGRPGAEALLKVRWSVMDPYLERVLAARESTYRQPVPTSTAAPSTEGAGQPPDRSALIAALSACVAAFSQDVAEVVRALPKPAQPPKSAGPN